MPTYALLGATGATGAAIVRSLLTSPPANLHLQILVRSKSKLLKTFPTLEQNDTFPVTITEGTPLEPAALEKCLRGAAVILQCIGVNASTPGESVCYDTISAIISTLQKLRDEQPSAYETPVLLHLRAAPVNPVLAAHMPAPVRWLLWFCFYFAYADHEHASELLVSATEASPGLFEHLAVDPTALHDPRGTTCTGFTIAADEKQSPTISYADLGAAFTELAGGRWKQFRERGGVGVSATGKVRVNYGVSLRSAAKGALARVWHAVGLM